MDGTEHIIEVGTMYALNNRDPHYLCGGEDTDLRLVCMFTPALQGDEHHDFSVSPTPRRPTEDRTSEAGAEYDGLE